MVVWPQTKPSIRRRMAPAPAPSTRTEIPPEKLEVAAEEARGLLKERRRFLDSADTIATFAAEMGDFLKTSELTETRAFVRSFVKEIEVKPGRAAIVYTIPTPEDSPIGGADAAEVALNGRVMSTGHDGGLRP